MRVEHLLSKRTADAAFAGQIVRFVRDPDGFMVITDGFDEHLKILMEYGYDLMTENASDDLEKI